MTFPFVVKLAPSCLNKDDDDDDDDDDDISFEIHEFK